MSEFFNAVPEGVTAAAFFSISFTLYTLARRRPDLKLQTPILVAAGFLVTCGIAHIWHPAYRLEIIMKSIGAGISAATAIVAIRFLPARDVTAPPQDSTPEPASNISARSMTGDELERVNEELRRSNTEVEQFAHVASHDLQEPLRMVTNYLQLIERRYDALLDDDGREFIRFAVDGAKRMKALIADLLDFSRAGTDAANFRPVPVSSILQNALANLKTAIDESGARISADPLPTMVVDPILLTQVFQNLIANAIKFQKNRAPRVHISARCQPSEWIFSVCDNGIGIEPHHLDRIFRIFERLHTTEEYSGSGIGLAITRKIIERHGGRIWAESQPSAGSTFYFSLSSETALAKSANSRPR